MVFMIICIVCLGNNAATFGHAYAAWGVAALPQEGQAPPVNPPKGLRPLMGFAYIPWGLDAHAFIYMADYPWVNRRVY